MLPGAGRSGGCKTIRISVQDGHESWSTATCSSATYCPPCSHRSSYLLGRLPGKEMPFFPAKAPVPDGVSNEALHTMAAAHPSIFTEMCNTCLTQRTLPRDAEHAFFTCPYTHLQRSLLIFCRLLSYTTKAVAYLFSSYFVSLHMSIWKS